MLSLFSGSHNMITSSWCRSFSLNIRIFDLDWAFLMKTLIWEISSLDGLSASASDSMIDELINAVDMWESGLGLGSHLCTWQHAFVILMLGFLGHPIFHIRTCFYELRFIDWLFRCGWAHSAPANDKLTHYVLTCRIWHTSSSGKDWGWDTSL